MKRNVEVLPNLAELVERARVLVVERAEAAIATHGQFTLAMAGGSTPKPLYEALANEALPWDKIHFFWGDERYVPPDHPDSNEGMARRTWLDKVAIPPGNIHPMPTDEADPAIAAQRYEQELQTFFQLSPGQFPSLDVILLGIGDDAHTASLFPYTNALKVRDKLVAVGNKNGHPRITLTVPTLNQAQCVLFLVAGANKQGALKQIFAKQADEMTYPARLIHPQEELWWLLDSAAGQNLGL